MSLGLCSAVVVQQAFSGVKAEVRQLLSKHQVTQMTMKPVKREYAFEDRNVRHGKQWVLKVSGGQGAVKRLSSRAVHVFD